MIYVSVMQSHTIKFPSKVYSCLNFNFDKVCHIVLFYREIVKMGIGDNSRIILFMSQ